jgi:hypothetical protein
MRSIFNTVSASDLNAILTHVNAARNLNRDTVDRCASLFNALNKLWSVTWQMERPTELQTDCQAFKFLLDDLHPEDWSKIRCGAALARLIELDPKS